MLIGKEQPDSGEIKVGDTVKAVAVGQGKNLYLLAITLANG